MFLPLLFAPRPFLLNFIKGIMVIFLIYTFLSLMVVILQYLLGPIMFPQFVLTSKTGLTYIELFDTKIPRPIGLAVTSNTLADSSLLILIFSLVIKKYYIYFHKIISLRNIKYLIYGSILIVVLSSSKHALVILFFIIPFIKKFKLKHFIFFSFSFLAAYSIFYTYNIYGFYSKINMYKDFITIVTDYPDEFEQLSGRIEIRAKNIYYGFQMILKNFPFGLGMGTWGDFSSTFNPNVLASDIYLGDIKYTKMSDIYLMHLIVEQGIFVIFFMYSLFKLSHFDRMGDYLFFSLLMVMLVTMGFSDNILPFIASLNLFLLNFIRRLIGNEDSTDFQYVSLKR